jgi:pyrroline-5-carboxylate reductase
MFQMPGHVQIAFIGGGNMARSLVGGMVAKGFAASRIVVAEPNDPLRSALARDFGVEVRADALQAAHDRHIWVFAIKPDVMRSVCESLAELAASNRPLVVSTAAGITTRQIQRWLAVGADLPVVRAMPNIPALLNAGATGLYATASVRPHGRRDAEDLLSSAGTTTWIEDEALMDAVTALSGSGPAYVFLLAEAMIAAGEVEGLPRDAARALALQTVLGAARMLVESGEAPGELRQRVTSPDGTTQAALESFERDGFRDMVERAIHAARVRGRELSAMND